MTENETVIDVTDETDESNDFPWKAVVVTIVVGAASAAVIAKIKSARKKAAETAVPSETETAAPSAAPDLR